MLKTVKFKVKIVTNYIEAYIHIVWINATC
jgi:hypothetical protein